VGETPEQIRPTSGAGLACFGRRPGVDLGVRLVTYYTDCNEQVWLFGVDGFVSLGWIVLGLVGWALGLVVLLTLFRMSGDQDRAARHEQKRLDPYSDVTITRSGEG
jgi:hypothetical protein